MTNNPEQHFYVVKVNNKIHTTTHDWNYANNTYLNLLRLPTHKKDKIKMLTYGYVRCTTSAGNTVKKSFA